MLGYASKIQWDLYLGTGRGRAGEAVFVEGADVKAIRRFAQMEDQTVLSGLLASRDEVSRDGKREFGGCVEGRVRAAGVQRGEWRGAHTPL